MDFFSNHQNGPSLSSIFSFKDISEKTQQHLSRVYGLVVVCSIVCSLGMYANATFLMSGFLLNLCSIILSVYLVAQIANKASNSENMRMGCLAGLSFQLGFIVGPVMHTLIEYEPQLVIQAVLYTATAFISFSLVSLCSKRRSMLFLGGVIACLMQGMALYSIFGWFLGYQFMNMTYLMFGLLSACLFVIYDTQLIIERAENGDKDTIMHAFILFIDLFKLFMKILQILMELKKNEERNKDKKKK